MTWYLYQFGHYIDCSWINIIVERQNTLARRVYDTLIQVTVFGLNVRTKIKPFQPPDLRRLPICLGLEMLCFADMWLFNI